jgi:hypothetical protein
MIKTILISLLVTLSWTYGLTQNSFFKKTASVLANKIIQQADATLFEKPITVTAYSSERSKGGKHDFFSEGDYWWPDTLHPNGPYIQRDGLTNPQNFTAHRLAMIRFSKAVGNLTSAYILTKNTKYSNAAMGHLKAWFIDTATLMNPSLLYGQAITRKVSGRGIGIIDMIQMIEVAQSVVVLEKAGLINNKDIIEIKNWFTQYLKWVTTHPYGIEEREAKNNHGTCWVMQVAVFAKLVGDTSLLSYCNNRFKTVLLPSQMAPNGSFPLEIKRTKPYGYSLFNLDAMVTLAHVLSTQKENLFDFIGTGNVSIKKGIEFMFPFIANKASWPYAKDVMYFDEWPVAPISLLFGSKATHNSSWFDTWQKLEHFPTNEEVIRNTPIRNPLIWINNSLEKILNKYT